MTTTCKMALSGFEEYLEKIVAAGNNIDEAAVRAVQAGSEVAQDGMSTRVAVLTGNLQDHIRIDGPHQEGDVIYAHVGIIPNQTDADTARYGNAQEYGTSSMPAHPYIRPTVDEDATKVRAAERKSLKQDGML